MSNNYIPSIALISLLSLMSAGSRANDNPSREHFAAPGKESSYHDWHYSPTVKVGDMVIISGIPAAGSGTYEEKVRRMFEALGVQLALAGATYSDVVELTTFHTGPTDRQSFHAELALFGPIHHEFFPSHYPAWSAVGTSALLASGAVMEMRAIAVIGSGRAPRAEIPNPKRQAVP